MSFTPEAFTGKEFINAMQITFQVFLVTFWPHSVGSSSKKGEGELGVRISPGG